MSKKKPEDALDFLDKWIGSCKKNGISLNKVSAEGDNEFKLAVKKNANDIRSKLFKSMDTESVANNQISTDFTFDNRLFPGSIAVIGKEIDIIDPNAFIECVNAAKAFEVYVTDDDSVKMEFTLEGKH